MAERRMFSKKIIDSDAFLDLPLSTQALYFHLAMRADDEGFINNQKRIMRMVGAAEDEYKLLIAKGFLIDFDSGVVVVKHWRIHNYIQKDRFKETSYTFERSMLGLKENNAYTMDTECIQVVPVGKDRLGKDRLGKDSKDKFDIGVFSDDEFKRLSSYRSQIKKAIKTQQAVTGLSNSFKACYDAGFTFDEVLGVMQEKQWQSVKVEWLQKMVNQNTNTSVASSALNLSRFGIGN